MATERLHRRSAAQSYSAACALRGPHPHWAIVPLFYSAMHLMLALFEADGLPGECRHTTQHVGLWRNGKRVQWGTNDVVSEYYPDVARFYRALFDAGWAVRYDTLRGAAAPLWGHHQRIEARAGASRR